MIAPFQPLRLWLPVTRGGWSAAGYFRSVFCSVSGPGGVECSSVSRGSYPTVWFASPSWFALSTHGAFQHNSQKKNNIAACASHGPVLKKHHQLHLPFLPAQPPLASGRCRRLRCFSAGGVTVGLIICWFQLFIYFSFLLCCPLCFQSSPQTQL